MATLCPAKIRAALHVDAMRVTQIVEEMFDESDHYAIRRIPDGGNVDSHDNHETIIYGQAKQAYKEYIEKDYSEKDLVEGDMDGVGCTGRTTTFETDINDIADNACSGECIIDFGQGFRRRGFKDFDIKPKTNVICASELAGKGPDHVRAFFKGFVDSFTRWGFDNFEANLLNMVIRYGEANASVQTQDYFGVTANGFIAPPQNRLSIWFLEQYRLHMVREKAIGENEYLEIEITRQDWMDAVRYHQIHIHGANVQFTAELYKDDSGPFRGREFGVYGGIKAYFNETPVKGYFKQTGQTVGGEKLYQFVRIYPWTNVVGEEAGLVTRPNHAYDQATIVCEGVTYDLCILAFVINSKSFKRYGKNTDPKPPGMAPMAPNNYTVKVLDGPWLSGEGCGNDYNEKFKLVARHQFRLTMPYPEFSGAIAYRASKMAGYVIPVCNVEPDNVTAATSTAAVFESCGGPLPCQIEVCQACGFDTADADGQCVDNPTDAVVQMVPCGSALTTFTGETHQLLIRVTRTGSTDGEASVDYTITDTPGTGLATTPEHYNDVSDDPGTVTWADGDGEDKFIKINIVDGDPDTNLLFTITLSNPTGVSLHSECEVLEVTIEDQSESE